jgi:serine/threonine protein kinase
MELCDKTLENVTNEFDKDSNLKSNRTLTTVGYYIATKIFLQILKGVNHLHKQNPSIISRDLKPANILLKRNIAKDFLSKSQTLDLWLFIRFENNRIL